MLTQLTRDELVSPAVYAHEGDRIFSRTWQCMGHLSQWATPNSYRLIELEGHSLIVVRLPDDSVRAFHNICRHRGTRLCSSPAAQLPKGCVTCPYHAWTYDLEGQLIGAPNMADLEGFRREDFPLLPVSAQVWQGLVMLHLQESPQPVSEAFSKLAQRISPWGLAGLVVKASLQYEVGANWKILFQNYSECYHCPTVHPELARLTPYLSATNDLTEGPILGGPMRLAPGFATVSRDGQAVGPTLPALDAQQAESVFYYTVFPNLFVSLHPDYVMLHTLHRRGLNRTLVDCHFLVPDRRASSAESPPESDFRAGDNDPQLAPAVDLWDQINRQDWEVCELTQLGVESPSYLPGPYSPLESMVAAFDSHYRATLQAATRDEP